LFSGKLELQGRGEKLPKKTWAILQCRKVFRNRGERRRKPEEPLEKVASKEGDGAREGVPPSQKSPIWGGGIPLSVRKFGGGGSTKVKEQMSMGYSGEPIPSGGCQVNGGKILGEIYREKTEKKQQFRNLTKCWTLQIALFFSR